MDHRIPLSRGGAHSLENVIPACKRCNNGKGTRTEEEFRAFLRDERERRISESERWYELSVSESATRIVVADSDIAVLLHGRAA